ncbi:MAG: ribosome maturation factor RimM [Myxococcota bacterium]
MERAGPRSDPPSPPGNGTGDDEIELGSVTGVFGFRGEVRLHLHNPESDWLRKPRRVTLVAPDGARTGATLSARPGAGSRIIGRLAHVADEAAATALRGHRIVVAKRDLPALEADEFYVWQLEGATVEIDGQVVGTVVGVQTAGPNDVLEVQPAPGPGGERSDVVFVLLLREFVREVDPVAKIVRLAPGALDE